jgi:hypothetical protein
LASNADQFYDFRFATGDSTVVAGGGDDSVRGSLGQDTVDGGTGDDTISTRDADDLISLSDNFGNDTITGGEAGETNGDTLDASGLTTSGVNVDFTASEAGTVTDDTTGDVATFFEIENIITTDQDDVIDASTVTAGGVNAESGGGDDTLIGGGADTLSGGDDADTFSGLSNGDVITGGEGGTEMIPSKLVLIRRLMSFMMRLILHLILLLAKAKVVSFSCLTHLVVLSRARSHSQRLRTSCALRPVLWLPQLRVRNRLKH